STLHETPRAMSDDVNSIFSSLRTHCALPEYKNDDHGWMNLTSPLDGVGSAYAAWVSCDDPHFPLPRSAVLHLRCLGTMASQCNGAAITLPVCGITDDPLQTVRLTK
ncbi:hypothetical protein PENTCL1PPCAC_30539, partial [Pristionchus entomophagus]